MHIDLKTSQAFEVHFFEPLKKFDVELWESNQLIELELQNETSLEVDFSKTSQRLDVAFAEFQEVVDYGGVEFYSGEYTVTPKVTAQTLETQHKYLTENVEVKEIPIYTTSNEAGGETVYIAKVGG